MGRRFATVNSERVLICFSFYLYFWTAVDQIITVVLAQDVQPDIVNADNSFGMFLGQAGVGNTHAIDHVNRARTNHAKVFSLFDNDGGILVDAEAEILGVLS